MTLDDATPDPPEDHEPAASSLHLGLRYGEPPLTREQAATPAAPRTQRTRT
ncbi:hypothetical protein ABZ734_11615 [Streptomyces sp. NPDC006660]|uniref:hypothetical protein n=1 Tax=Streptomyces sp. NPDC006660 TaxID=3156901 RepID=UPI0033FEB6E2